MKIFEFVITGGPCSGKTTCLSMLDQTLTQKGFKVIIVSETATEVISSGFHPSEVPRDIFQALILDRSLNKEETTRRVAKTFKKDVVIVYDRGVLDSKAYLPQVAFDKILAERGLKETKIRDSYDAVFHLVTAANGAEEYYTLSNNAARTESPEVARALDVRTRNAWVGHPHLRVIDNSTKFEEKVNRLIAEALSVIGIPVPIEIEHKYLIERPTDKFLKSIGAVKLNILQTYLHSEDPLTERRIRQRGTDRDFTYYYTEKRPAPGGQGRIEIERRISESEYLILLMEGEKSIRKDRYCFVHDSQYFELDIYPKWRNRAVLEIELTREHQRPSLPGWVRMIKDVTNDAGYKNAALADAFGVADQRGGERAG